MSALFGVDISNFQAGISIPQIQAEGFSWVECKCSEGSYYRDPTWPVFSAAAKGCGLPCLPYHYAISADTPASQVATFKAGGGGDRVMIDFEANSGTIDDLWALIGAFNAAGVYVAMVYLPQWYWQQIGSPSLQCIPGLIASNYPGGSGYASSIYTSVGGDNGAGWASYGGVTPLVWQFSDQASVAGRQIDVNAFRGTESELLALITGSGANPPEGEDMQLTDTLTNAAGQQVTVAQILSAIDFHASMALEQQAGPGTSEQPGPALTATGWPQLANHSIVDALAVIGQHMGIAGFQAPGGAA